VRCIKSIHGEASHLHFSIHYRKLGGREDEKSRPRERGHTVDAVRDGIQCVYLAFE
jgi:hypothetical protein